MDGVGPVGWWLPGDLSMDVGPAVTSSTLPQGRVGRTFQAAAPSRSWQPDQGLRLPVPGVDTPGRWCLPSWEDGSYRAQGLALTAECVPQTLLGNGLQSGPGKCRPATWSRVAELPPSFLVQL